MKLKRKRNITIAVITCFLLYSPSLNAQVIRFIKNNLQPVNVLMSIEKLMGRQVIKVTKDSTIRAVDQPTFVRIANADSKNGSTEVNVLS